MKPEQLYHHLKELAEKLGVSVSEQNLRKSGIAVKSGLCKVKNDTVFIMDKHLSVRDKTEVLVECLIKMPHEEVFTIPAVRELLDKYSKAPKA